MAGNFHAYHHDVMGIHHGGGVALLIAKGERCPQKNSRLTRHREGSRLVF
jgi:hypothetical protein